LTESAGLDKSEHCSVHIASIQKATSSLCDATEWNVYEDRGLGSPYISQGQGNLRVTEGKLYVTAAIVAKLASMSYRVHVKE
jgi:hypothetical protein